MHAVSFNGCRGWLHDAPGDTVAVMCGAQGYEELCTQRGWFELAEMIAAQGFPALRFDYAGSGDSLGGDTDAARMEAWRGSVKDAIGFARKALGARKIILIGLRLGALLAAEACAADAEIAGLAMLGAPASGRAYAREMQVLASVVGLAPEGAAPWPVLADGFQVGGFFFSGETVAALGKLPKAAALLEACGPRPALALTRAELAPGGAQTPSAARRALPFAGYQAFVIDRIFSAPPAADWAAVCAWLAQNWPPQARGAAAPRPPQAAGLRSGHFAETPAAFGPGGKLSGVHCMPVAAPAARAVVIANTGANHHIGWGRASVDLARLLAARGIASLRIDASGLGNSAALPGRAARQVYELETVADVGAALGWLELQGYKNFGIVGACSGAHLAFHASLADARLSRAAVVNLYRFTWPQGLQVEDAVRAVYRPSAAYARKAADPRTLLRLLKGEIDVFGIARALGGRLATRLRARLMRHAGGLLSRDADTLSAVGADTPRHWLRRLARRQTRMLFVYSSQDAGLDEVDRHFGSLAALAALPGVSAATVADADHNFSPQWARGRLFELVVEFAAEA